METPAVRLAFVVAFGAAVWVARRRTRRHRPLNVEQWAAAHGYRQAEPPRRATTPVLRQRPQVLRSYDVPLGSGTGTLCDLTISTADGDLGLTAVVASVGGGLPRFGVYDRELVGYQGQLGSWVGPAGLDTGPMQEVHLGSVAFEGRYQLLADRASGDVAVEDVLTPRLVEWWTDQGDTGPSLEYEDGTMLVARPRCSDRAGELDRLIEQAAELVRGISAAGTPRPADPV